jgi:peroxiredoxin
MNQKVPDIVFKTRVRDESIDGPNPFRWQDISSAEIFNGKRIVLFALPGAFTPTCSTTHLPGYEKLYDSFKHEGVDEVYCLSVNDAFTMYQWGKQLGAKNVKLLPDGSCAFTKGMDMLVSKDNVGFGLRSWRYSMLIEDGDIVKLFSETGKQDNSPDDPFEVSDAETMLTYVRGRNT